MMLIEVVCRFCKKTYWCVPGTAMDESGVCNKCFEPVMPKPITAPIPREEIAS